MRIWIDALGKCHRSSMPKTIFPPTLFKMTKEIRVQVTLPKDCNIPEHKLNFILVSFQICTKSKIIFMEELEQIQKIVKKYKDALSRTGKYKTFEKAAKFHTLLLLIDGAENYYRIPEMTKMYVGRLGDHKPKLFITEKDDLEKVMEWVNKMTS